jgi:DNA-binding PucR family transcriptional regulator
MGNHVVEITEASVDLDYNEILENIEDTIAERMSAQITDEAWDAVEYSVSDAISDSRSDHESEYDHDDIGNGNDGVTSGVQELLLDYRRHSHRVGLG